MKVNINLELSNQDRNLIARKIAGRSIKRLCTRAEVTELVRGFMAGYITELAREYVENYTEASFVGDDLPHPEKPDLSRVPEKYQHQSDQWKVSYLRGRYGK